MAFLLNKFCSRLAVYLGNYVILLLFSPSGPFHLALWEDSLVIFLTHSGGKLLCQTHFRHSTGSVLPVLALSDYFFTVSLAHTLLSFTLYIPPSLTCTRAARRRLTAADDFHDAHFFQLFVTHTHSRSRSQMRNLQY